MHFLVHGDTKLGVFEEILRQKVLASTNFCQILVLGIRDQQIGRL